MARKFLGVAASLLANWVTWADIAPVRNPQSSAYSVQASDLGKLIECTGTWTLGTLAASAAGAGFYFYVKKTDGTGIITIDPNSSETIEGLTSIALYGGECGYKIWTDGTAWYTLGRQKGWITVINSVSVAAATASVSVSSGAGDAEVSALEVDYEDLITSNNSQFNLTLTQTSAGTPVGEWTNGNSTTLTAAAVSASPWPMAIGSSTAGGGSILLRNIQGTAASNIRGFTQASNVAFRIGGFSLSTTGAFASLALTPALGTITSMRYSTRVYRD